MQNSQTPSDLSAQFYSQIPQLTQLEEQFTLNKIDTNVKLRDMDNQFELLRLITQTKKHKLMLRVNGVLQNKRNRYPQQQIYQHSRVVLQQPETATSNEQPTQKKQQSFNNYINANHSRSLSQSPSIDNKNSQIILTQAPLKQTVADFLQTIVYNNIKCVVMLCNVVENGKNRCYHYLGQSVYYQSVQVVEASNGVQLRNVVVNANQYIGQSAHQFIHILYTQWPDKSVPEHPSNIHNLLQLCLQHSKSDNNSNRILIHCSAGLGRSGVVAVLYHILNKIEQQTKQLQKNNLSREKVLDQIGKIGVSVFGSVRKLREDRFGAVQNNQQYRFIYQYLQYYYHQLNSSMTP